MISPERLRKISIYLQYIAFVLEKDGEEMKAMQKPRRRQKIARQTPHPQPRGVQ